MKKTHVKDKTITYSQVGDNYATKDPVLRYALSQAKKTGNNLKSCGFEELEGFRGESAFVWDQGKYFMASVTECLGTKNLIADEMRKHTGKTYYDVIAQDTVATFINDLVTVGAKPLVVNAYWAIGDNKFICDKRKMTDFINGWTNACNLAGAVWGGGETSTLKGIIFPDTADLAGSAVGIISPKERLISERKLKGGDRILFLKSNGINANGVSLARSLAGKLTGGYKSRLDNGLSFGEALLSPTNIYANLVQDLLNHNIDIHYIVNITGHGLRKLMRARQKFTYIVEKIFKPTGVFSFIKNNLHLSDHEMYQTFNMGMDYALFMPAGDTEKAQNIIKSNKFESIVAGYIKKGTREVVIKPKNIIYKSESYSIKN
ncbi:AIR synthase related protein [Patescibacteria group bacterium]|nr:AIR synthase related protein [Patescibacteria group bacterium]MCL5797747.1 AIR synthase related protein [Patescibacteria group bacterium]